nr:MAG TPA: hypothetical protein [Caudoviricetes sp.]
MFTNYFLYLQKKEIPKLNGYIHYKKEVGQ